MDAVMIVAILVVIADLAIAYFTNDKDDKNDKYIPIIRNIKKALQTFSSNKKRK